ncbi:Thiol-disulfide isomerase or thioredoxin [Cognatiyoonia sediminum]|uniref:Thiol-disulfide isomerase or thioredoxin n=1 Tax=Cognatiyoonia sediminum TaxID=1508389 RepID=A0A1M5PU61_9RHOB|nr:TlpA disulfide reductase family protein [Cognatiyoonia sediminum]SHH05517.1 Thiol-disulfide isomerase or thioredoxin [Cognatiyoonia sediminum]
MGYLKSALLYLSLGVLANSAVANTADLEAMREGDMRKLTFHSDPLEGSDVPFLHEDGSEMTLADYEGKHIVLNFWATWCAPCRKEMPGLSELQEELGGDDFAVVTIATGRNPRPAMEAFFDEIGVDNLPLHSDERQNLARSLGVLGLPVTMILDPEGNEVARLQGDAEWNSQSAKDILAALTSANS